MSIPRWTRIGRFDRALRSQSVCWECRLRQQSRLLPWISSRRITNSAAEPSTERPTATADSTVHEAQLSAGSKNNGSENLSTATEQPDTAESGVPIDSVSKFQSLKNALGSTTSEKPTKRSPSPTDSNPSDDKAKEPRRRKPPALDPKATRSIWPKTHKLIPIEIEQPSPPGLSYGLDRVLFNPGVYHLQDPRSRVYNFDPYLEKIIPAAEFDYSALKQYKTSSKDEFLWETARQRKLKYLTSTSSITGLLQQMHLLVSRFRELNVSMLSRTINAESRNMTRTQFKPEAVFLRQHNNRYAIDKDNSLGSGTVLSFVGRTLEKLLTVPKAKFEQFRRNSEHPLPDSERGADDSYHYTYQGKIMVRSQLDGHDPRLPGSGVFDIKTRAVAPVRLDNEDRLSDVTRGYQIRRIVGDYESFEREYYDLMRTVMLKYSLQLRLGRMDGAFVAYHNVDRLFGFQYVSLADMDLCLHGQTNPTLGDQELKASMNLLQAVFEVGTKRFPGKSLWIHVDTKKGEFASYFFIEPIADETIDSIQTDIQQKEAEMERQLLSVPDSTTSLQPGSPEAQDELRRLSERLSVLNQKISSHIATFPGHAAFFEKIGPLAEDAAKEPRRERVVNALVSIGLATSHLDEEFNNILKEIVQLEPEAGPAQAEARKIEHIVDAMNTKMAALPVPMDCLDEAFSLIRSRKQLSYFEVHMPSDLLALKLQVENEENGVLVDRVGDFREKDNWVLRYTLEELKSKDEAMDHYEQMRKRMKSLLREESTDDGFYNSAFMRQLIRLSEKGKKWREKQDELDSQRERVVYSPRES